MGSFKLLRKSELPLFTLMMLFSQISHLIDSFRQLAVVSEQRTWQRGRLKTVALRVRLSVVE